LRDVYGRDVLLAIRTLLGFFVNLTPAIRTRNHRFLVVLRVDIVIVLVVFGVVFIVPSRCHNKLFLFYYG
jgi:isocitrate/isopropylmalate dehydrogenase